MARTEGKAHLTATSQGVIIFNRLFLVYRLRYICFITNVIFSGKNSTQKSITPYDTLTEFEKQNKNPRQTQA